MTALRWLILRGLRRREHARRIALYWRREYARRKESRS